MVDSGGHFSTMFSMEAKLGGNPINSNDIKDGVDWLQHFNLEEVNSMGPRFSWSNRQMGTAIVYSKLDWVFCNESWHDTYNSCSTSYYEESISNHCFLLVKCICPEDSRVKPFRFFNMWCDFPKYKDLVSSTWLLNYSGSHIQRLGYKLNQLRHKLKLFNRSTVGDVVIRYKESSMSLDTIRQQLHLDPLNHSLIDLEKEALSLHSQASITYEKFMHQKSKITWLRLGDSGSGYFHASMKSRGTKDRILSYNEGGCKVDKFVKVVNHFIHHFKAIMGTNSHTAHS